MLPSSPLVRDLQEKKREPLFRPCSVQRHLLLGAIVHLQAMELKRREASAREGTSSRNLPPPCVPHVQT